MEDQKEITHFVKVIINEKGKDSDIVLKHSQEISIIEVLEAAFTLFAYAKKIMIIHMMNTGKLYSLWVSCYIMMKKLIVNIDDHCAQYRILYCAFFILK